MIVCDRCLQNPVWVNGGLCGHCYGSQVNRPHDQQYGIGQWAPPIQPQHMPPQQRTWYDPDDRRNMSHFEHEQDRDYRPVRSYEGAENSRPSQSTDTYPHPYHGQPQASDSGRPQVFEQMKSETADNRTSTPRPLKMFTPSPDIEEALRDPEKVLKPCPLRRPSISPEQHKIQADGLAHNRTVLDQYLERIMDSDDISTPRVWVLYRAMRLIHTWRQELDSLLEKPAISKQQQQDSIPALLTKPPTPPCRWPNSRMPGRQRKRHQA